MGHLFPHIRWQDELRLEMRTAAYGASLVSLGSFVVGILTIFTSAVLGHLLNERWPDVNWKDGLDVCFLLVPATFVLTFGPILILYRSSQEPRPRQ